jgi:hypothetical protein
MDRLDAYPLWKSDSWHWQQGRLLAPKPLTEPIAWKIARFLNKPGAVQLVAVTPVAALTLSLNRFEVPGSGSGVVPL